MRKPVRISVARVPPAEAPLRLSPKFLFDIVDNIQKDISLPWKEFNGLSPEQVVRAQGLWLDLRHNSAWGRGARKFRRKQVHSLILAFKQSSPLVRC